MTDEKHSSPIKFPCDFTVKVMCKTSETAEKAIFSIIQKHFHDINEEKISKRASKDNNYIALSFELHVQKKAELDALYTELSDTPEVLMAL